MMTLSFQEMIQPQDGGSECECSGMQGTTFLSVYAMKREGVFTKIRDLLPTTFVLGLS